MRAYKQELTMLGVMFALAIITAILNPHFLGADNLTNNIRHISLISLFALGQAVVIIAGGIDLSVGAIVGLTACMISYLATTAGLGIVPAVILGLLVAVAIGALQGWVIARLGMTRWEMILVTIGSTVFLHGVAETVTQGSEIGFQGEYPTFRFLGEGSALGLPMPFWFALVAIAITAFVMHRTNFGRHCYAIGSNAEAPGQSGAPVQRIRLITFVVSAGLSGVAGVLYVAYLPAATPALGSAYGVQAVAVAALGGCWAGRGTVLGVLIGAGIMQVTFNATLLMGPYSLWLGVIQGAMILIAVIVASARERRHRRSSGLAAVSADEAKQP